MSKQIGYYPDFSTLEQRDSWDVATRAVIDARMQMNDKTPLRFFTGDEASLLRVILNIVLPQDDREADKRIPILAMIDERLASRRFNGYVLEGSVEDDQAHRLALTEIARLTPNFAFLSLHDQESILIAIKDGEVKWSCAKQVPPAHYWRILMDDAISAYYAHPYAWDEIGFGGPAYPRGYMRLTDGLPEPWEVDEQRYEWHAPAESRSDKTKDNHNLYSENPIRSQSGSGNER